MKIFLLSRVYATGKRIHDRYPEKNPENRERKRGGKGQRERECRALAGGRFARATRRVVRSAQCVSLRSFSPLVGIETISTRPIFLDHKGTISAARLFSPPLAGGERERERDLPWSPDRVQTIAGKIVRGQPGLTGIDEIIVASDTPDADETASGRCLVKVRAVDLIVGSTSRCGEMSRRE